MSGRQRHPDVEQDAMFDVPAAGAGTSPEAPRPEKSIRTARCPKCVSSAEDRRVGVVRRGDGVEVFRDHDKFTVGGRRIPCSGSGLEAPSW